MFTFNTPITELPKIGPKIAKKFKKLQILNVKDLLYHFPVRYDDYRKILPITKFKTQGSGVIYGKVKFITSKRSPQKRMLITEAIVSDKTDSVKIIWFNQSFLTRIIKPGMEIYLGGKIERNGRYGLEFINPDYEIYRNRPPLHFGRLVPVYQSTSNLSQKQIRFLIKTALSRTKIIDWLPVQIKNKYCLANLDFSLQQIHFPKDIKWKNLGVDRLKFDELFLAQLRSQVAREKIKKCQAPAIKFKLPETQKFVENLPFKLTNEQRKASWQIIKDLSQEKPMNRLLEGEVGSGKTIVAVIGILNVILNNSQAAYLAPTEILANQQFNNISSLLKNTKKGLKIALFTRNNLKINRKKIKKKEMLDKLSSGQIDLVIGTHTLIQKKVNFSARPNGLALVIVDEQQRFGAAQRAKLTEKTAPHFLSMTATPIPRSLALVFYGDLDISIIKGKPPGRKEVETKIIETEKLETVYEFVRKKIKAGRQAFVVCPLIDPSDKLGALSVKEEGEKLNLVFPKLKIGLLHGKLKAEEKDKIMKKILKNKINILISTTVVEVGIDIPNATIMIIESAERFGLAQLYQLRGRIGRGTDKSYCFLIQGEESRLSRLRLQSLLEAKTSLELAEKDLSLRGPGKIYGPEQSGFLSEFRLADLNDFSLIQKTKKAASNRAYWPLMQEKINEFSKKIIHLN